MVEPKIVALGLAGSNPVYHPIVGSVLVRSRSHKPQVRQFDSDPRNKKDFEFWKIFIIFFKINREVVAAVARKAHNLEVGGSIPSLATKGLIVNRL